MSEHTAGPWDYIGKPTNIHVVEEANPHMRICFLTSNGPTIANARLIAAAPDLLEALLSVRKLISEAAQTGFNWKRGDWAARLYASQADSSAAIAKATGAP